MPATSTNRTSTDPVSILMEITAAGTHAEITYRKGGREGSSVRVIEPRQLVDGAYGLMIRAVQVEPEPGLRCFCVHKIVEVRPHPLPLPPRAKKGNNFCTGEVIALSVSNAPVPTAVQPVPAPGPSIWSLPWFTRYLGRLREALVDGTLDDDELAALGDEQRALRLEDWQMRAVHAYLFAEELFAASHDGSLGPAEAARIEQIAECLRALGWAPCP